MEGSMTMYHQTYWLPGEPRQNSTTGKMTCEPRGPFSVAAVGCALKPLTEEEVRQYVLRLHGTLPIKIETEEVGA
jgi:hypothetical protein